LTKAGRSPAFPFSLAAGRPPVEIALQAEFKFFGALAERCDASIHPHRSVP